MERDEVVGWALNALAHALAKKDKNGNSYNFENEEVRKQYFDENLQSELIDVSEGRRATAAMIFTTVQLDIVKLIKEVKENRNDINHFGMRKEPKAPKKLKEKLEILLKKFEEIEGR